MSDGMFIQPEALFPNVIYVSVLLLVCFPFVQQTLRLSIRQNKRSIVI